MIKKLDNLLSDIDPIIYHCSDLRNVKYEDRDTDILRDGIIPPSMYDEFDTEIDGSGYGGSLAPKDANMLDHICVWVQDGQTPMTMEETINTMKGEKGDNIVFILNPDIEWKLVNSHTDKEYYHDSEGLVRGPLEVNNQNIEAVVIAKDKILKNYSIDDAYPSQKFWKNHIEAVKNELEDRNITVYLTQTLPNW